MSELLLQTIIEKLEALEIALLKQNNSDKDASIIKEMAEQLKELRSETEVLSPGFKLMKDKMSELMKRLEACDFRLQQPLQNNFEHKHHLHKGILISAGLAIIAMFLSWGWITSYQSKKSFEANDMKYRALKVAGNKTLLGLLHEIDSLYDLDEKGLRKNVVAEEQRLIQQAEMLRLAGEKEGEANELKNQIKNNKRNEKKKASTRS